MHCPARILLILALCAATFAAGALGLSNGMVLCADGHGRVAVEVAHAAAHVGCHGHERDACHAGGGDGPHRHHGPAPEAPAGEHGQPCSDWDAGDAFMSRAAGAAMDASRLFALDLVAPVLIGAAQPRSLPDTSLACGRSSEPARGSPRAELACLQGVVLLI